MPFANLIVRRIYHREYYRNHRDSICVRTAELRLLNRDRINLKQREEWAKKREEYKKYYKIYREKNKDKIQKWQKKYRNKNRDRIRQFSKNFRLRHPERVKLNSIVQTFKRRTIGKITIDKIQRIYESNIKKFKTLTCILCYRPIRFKDDSIDHKIPVKRGGTNEYKNLGVAHLICNRKKGIMTLGEWFLKYPQLKKRGVTC